MEIFNYYFEMPTEIPALNVTGVFFILYVLICSLLLFFNNKHVRNIILFLASCFFIWTFSKDYYYLIVSLLVCIFGYLFGFLLNKFKNKLLLIISVIVTVLFLIVFKNAYIFNNSIIVPLGISFYALRLIWYLNHIYNDRIEFNYNPLYLFNYIIFFPCFTAGPIEKPDHFINQLKEKGNFCFKNLREGWFRFLYGIFEKIVICDFVGTIVDKILPVPEVNGVTVLVGVVLYSFQIYLDFDSYSNIAIGVSKIFGLDVEENFKTPYLSVNIKEFWSRWHISLSTWLKENVYIPLGGNKKGAKRKIVNICLVFIVSGLWHGSSLNFIIWGLLHALLRIVEDYLESKINKIVNIDYVFFKPIRIIINFCLVTILWIVFKCDNLSDILSIFGRIFINGGKIFSTIEITHNEIIWLNIVLAFTIIVDIVRYFVNVFYWFAKMLFPFRYIIYAAGIFIFLVFGVYGGSFNSTDFIYRWF